MTLGVAETKTFGDTPYAIRAGADGLAAKFAAGDYVIAAQRPQELLRQSLEAMGGNLRGSPSGNRPPRPQSQGSNAPIDISIIAEGRILDQVQVTALDRGHAPMMEQKLKRASGVNVGFSRGKFNKWTV